MKNKYYIVVALLATTLTGIIPAMGQSPGSITETVSIGSTNEIYYNLSTGTQTPVNRKQWDIAFRANRMSASILTNDGSGIELYAYPKADTSGWASVDTNGLYAWKKMFNSTTDWEEGAFVRNQKGHPDYGWGRYNSASHNVVGDSLFIIKLMDGSFRKLWIMEKFSADNVFEFRFAKLDGSDQNTIQLDCTPFSTKNYVGYSLGTNTVVDFEPVASAQWDLLFTKYNYTYPSGAVQVVTGVLSNYKVKVAEFDSVAPDFLMLEPQVMDSTRSPIGFDWKTFDMVNFVYVITDSLAYFVQDRSGKIYKLVFTNYIGGSSGSSIFQKELNSFTGVNENQKSGVNAAIYPNPVKDVMNLVINPGKSEVILVSVLNMTGKTVLSKNYELPEETLSTLQVPVSDLSPGMYVVRIQVGTSTIARKVIVNK
jgi:hypothetical protein